MSKVGSTRAPLGVILNAGLGTRLRPVTPALPKALVPVLNRPLIDYSIEYLLGLGLREIAIVVSPGDEATATRAREVAPEGVTIRIAVQEEPRGIGHAVTSVGELLDDRVVVVLAADTLLVGDDGGYLQQFVSSNAAAGLVLCPVKDPRAFGVAILEGARIVALEEKPAKPRSNLALVGIWLLRASAIERLREHPVINGKGEADLTATIAQLLSEGAEVQGWQTSGEWLDAGTVEGLLGCHSRLLLDLQAQGEVPEGCSVDGVVALPPSATASRSHFSGQVLLGNDTSVEGCEIADSVVCDGASVVNTRLVRCLVLPGASVRGGMFEDVVITAAGEIAGPGAKRARSGGRLTSAQPAGG